MKKNFLFAIVFLVAAVSAIDAQNHSYADTTYYPYWQFDPEEWVRADTSNDFLYINYQNPPWTYGIFQFLQYNYTDNPNGVEVAGLRIYGQPTYVQPNEPFPINVYLYDSEVDTFVLKVDTLFDVPGHYVPHQFDSNFLINPASYDNDYTKCIDGCRPAYYIRMYEDVFFEKPVRVFDSFYVGMDFGRALFSDHDELEPMPWSTLCYESQLARPIECRFPPILWKYRMTYRYPFVPVGIGEVNLNQWVYNEQNDFFICLLPLLVSVDTTAEPPACPEVRNLRVYRQYGDEVTLKWDRNGGQYVGGVARATGHGTWRRHTGYRHFAAMAHGRFFVCRYHQHSLCAHHLHRIRHAAL